MNRRAAVERWRSTRGEKETEKTAEKNGKVISNIVLGATEVDEGAGKLREE